MFSSIIHDIRPHSSKTLRERYVSQRLKVRDDLNYIVYLSQVQSDAVSVKSDTIKFEILISSSLSLATTRCVWSFIWNGDTIYWKWKYIS